jgi:hypothetical protein
MIVLNFSLKENSFNPDMIVRLEMESFWLELETRLKVEAQNTGSDCIGDEDRIHVELNKTRDLKYSPKFLPNNFYSKFLAQMPTQFPMTLDFWRYSSCSSSSFVYDQISIGEWFSVFLSVSSLLKLSSYLIEHK